MNKTILIGRVGRNPRLVTTANGPMVFFSVATNEHWTAANGEARVHTEWHQLVCFDRLAEIARDFLLKGLEVYVEGRLHTSRVSAGAQKQSGRVIRVEELRMLRSPRSESTPLARQLESIEQLARALHAGERADCSLEDLANLIRATRELMA